MRNAVLNKRLKARDFIVSGTDMVPTDILSLDMVLGGGFNRGDMVEISSESGVGKSTMVLHVVRNFLARDLRCMYLDVERGVQVGMLDSFKIREKMGTEFGDPFLLLSPTTFSDLDEILSLVMQDEGRYDLIVIDSITALLPGKLQTVSVDEIQPGLEARSQGAILKKWKPSFRELGTTCVLVNQLRTKLDFMRGSKVESAGGFALQFYPDVRIRMRSGRAMKTKERTALGTDDVIYGNEAYIWCVKNRSQRPEVRLRLPVIFGKGVSNAVTAAGIMRANDLMVGGGAGWFTLQVGSEEVKIHGEQAAVRWIRENYAQVISFLREGGYLELLTEGEA